MFKISVYKLGGYSLGSEVFLEDELLSTRHGLKSREDAREYIANHSLGGSWQGSGEKLTSTMRWVISPVLTTV